MLGNFVAVLYRGFAGLFHGVWSRASQELVRWEIGVALSGTWSQAVSGLEDFKRRERRLRVLSPVESGCGSACSG